MCRGCGCCDILAGGMHDGELRRGDAGVMAARCYDIVRASAAESLNGMRHENTEVCTYRSRRGGTQQSVGFGQSAHRSTLLAGYLAMGPRLNVHVSKSAVCAQCQRWLAAYRCCACDAGCGEPRARRDPERQHIATGGSLRPGRSVHILGGNRGAGGTESGRCSSAVQCTYAGHGL